MNGGTFNNEGTDILIGCPDRHLEDGGFGNGILSTELTKSEILIQGNISFQNPNNNIVMDAQIYYNEVDGKGFPLLGAARPDDEYFFAPQEVTLNFGPFSNTKVYFNEQDANYIPITSGSSGNRCTFGDDQECTSNQYANKTNSQLNAQYENSFAGFITPNTAVSHPMIIGGKVGEITSDPCEGATPTTPTSLTFDNNNCNAVQLSWPAVQCASTYTLQRRVDGGSWSTLSNDISGTSYIDTDEEIGVLVYRLRAQNDNGNSGFKSSTSFDCSSGNPTFYTLNINSNGNGSGAVTLSPSGGTYLAGTSVTITATPNSNSQFDNWSGDASGVQNPISVILDRNKLVNAHFSLMETEEDQCEWYIIDEEDFESGWGIWNDGGSDCRRSVNDEEYASNGEFCIRLRDNSSTSVMTTDDLELSDYRELEVSFSYYARSMDNNNEDFWLQISVDGGDNYETVEEWNHGDEFENDEFYFSEVLISDIAFTDETRLRFRCDASANSDWVYIDEVIISGCHLEEEEEEEGRRRRR